MRFYTKGQDNAYTNSTAPMASDIGGVLAFTSPGTSTEVNIMISKTISPV